MPLRSTNLSLTLLLVFTAFISHSDALRASADSHSWMTFNILLTIPDSTATLNIVLPADVSIACTDPSDPATLGFATGNGSCSGTIAVTYEDSSAAVGCAGGIIRIWTASDDCGNVVSGIQNIGFTDSDPPSLTVPADAFLSCTDDTSPTGAGTATATDNCGAPDVSYTDLIIPLECPANVFIFRTWTATDACGNSVSADQLILRTDDFPPVLSMPADTTIACNEDVSPATTGTATATDNCDSIVLTTYTEIITPGGTCDASYTIKRTWTATDACGFASSGIQTINVVDENPPLLTLPPDTAISCGMDDSPAALGSAIAIDICDPAPGVSFTDSLVMGACPSDSIISRIWTGTDQCGNTATAAQTITIVDDEAPALSTPADTLIACTEDSSPLNTGMAFGDDVCTGVIAASFVDSTIAGSCPSSFTIYRLWKSQDTCGNFSTAMQTIEVADTSGPVLDVPLDRVLDCNADASPSATGFATVAFDCGTATVVYSDSVEIATCGDLTITRTWSATDDCGNTTTGGQTITLTDNEPPVLTIPLDITIVCTADDSPASTGLATATDNCDTAAIITYTDNPSPGDCGAETGIARIWRATDVCGNFSEQIQVIKKIDTVAPILSVPPMITLSCDQDLSPAGAADSASAVDNCDPNPVITYIDSITGTCYGPIIRTWTATDNCANSTTATQIINVYDNDPPVLNIPADVSLACTDDISPAGAGTATATDNCGIPLVSFTDSVSAAGCSGSGGIIRTWTATDACGNSTSAEQTISVDDSDPPLITVPADTVLMCGDDSSPSATGMASATDSCDAAPAISFLDSVSVSGISRFWTATDLCGNATSVIQLITITDSIPPATASCPGDITVEADMTDCTMAIVTWTEPVFTDSCSSVSVSSSNLPGDTFPLGISVVTYTATDASGNESTCSFIVDVKGLEITSVVTTDETFCKSKDGTVTIEFTGGTPDYFIVMNDSAYGPFSSSPAVITGLRDMVFDSLVLTDANGCSYVDTMQYTILDPAVVEIDTVIFTDPTGCGTNDGSIWVDLVDSLAGIPPYLISINGVDYGPFASEPVLVDSLAPGIFTFVKAIDGNGCFDKYYGYFELAEPNACFDCDPPDGLTSTILTPEKVNLQWNNVPLHLSFEVKGREVGASAWKSAYMLPHSMKVGKLTPGATYEWKVRVLCWNLDMSAYSFLSQFTLPTARIEHKKLTLVPNPADQFTSIRYTADREEDVRIVVTDITGKVLYLQEQTLNKGMNDILLDTKLYHNGIHFVHVDGPSGNAQVNFVIAR